jgi:hypothetical protein
MSDFVPTTDSGLTLAPHSASRSERGYIMTMMVILMPVLLGFMALAVDATYYWFRGVQVQRAADAASLAGVVRMPKFSEAKTAADEITKRNGFVNGQEQVVVLSERIPNNNKRFKVTIKDNNVGIFFGRIFQNSWTITRSSTAEYISNIPLGSKENAIGTGYLTDSGTKQNFWLAVSGPCSPKESGDQFMSRYDGNGVNPNIYPAATKANERFAMLCDVNADDLASSNVTGVGYLREKRDQKPAELFPALVRNLDYTVGKDGYDYIVDVPCNLPGAPASPPPCASTETLPGDLVIQMYDPVFNPDSIQRWAQRVTAVTTRTDNSGFTNEVDDKLKPDKYNLVRPEVTNCDSSSANLPNCKPADLVGTDGLNPKPWDVRVTTDVRLYPPDNTPLDYSDDKVMQLERNVVDTADNKFVFDSEVTPVKGVRRFESCVKLTDGWTSIDSGGNYYSVPNAAGSDFAPGLPVAGTTPDQDRWETDPDAPNSNCAEYASQWVTIKRVSSTNRRGRYRLNIRTIDAKASFGSNAFALRAFFIPASTAAFADPGVATVHNPPHPTESVLYPPCLKPEVPTCPTTSPLEQSASVAGDSTMSVFANVNDISRFYLAQLSPAKLFRNKVVVVSLWDPGEGAAKLQILRPEADSNTCPAGTADGQYYCVQKFQWTVGRTGLATFDPTDRETGLSSTSEYKDVCADKGRPLPSELTEPNFLEVAQPYGTTDGTAIDGCVKSDSDPTPKVQPDEIKNSRQFKREETERKFNDRLVTVSIKVPENYGCAVNTGIVVGSTFVPCTELEGTTAGLPQGGWWKIKYFPKEKTVIDASGNDTGVPVTGPDAGYKRITDRTTWSVGLRGDPVHLVPNGQ